MKAKLVLVVILLIINNIICIRFSNCQVRLPRLVSDSMILQRDAKIKIWGWASQNEKVTVKFLGKTFNSITGSNCKWIITLPPTRSGGPYDMEITGSNTITLKNIYLGDMWVCAGQSNMVIPMERVKYKYPEEIAQCTNNLIRQFIVPDAYDYYNKRDDIHSGTWTSANPVSILKFSAVGYFFAR